MDAPTHGPFSVLPPEARNRPGFVPGVGSMIAANQPALRREEPAAEGYKPTLSDKTKASIEALAAFQAQAQHLQEKEVDPVSTEVKERADAAANLGKVVEKVESDLYADLKRDIPTDEDHWNLLTSPKRRKEIEDRLSPMNVTDVIFYGEIRQDVPIIPDKLVVSYRSVSVEEDLSVKQMMYGESGGDRYLMDKYTIMQLTLALVSINGDELPTHLDEKKRFNEEKFLRKYEKVSKFAIQFAADLGVQYLWFDERVRRLFVGSSEVLKNT